LPEVFQLWPFSPFQVTKKPNQQQKRCAFSTKNKKATLCISFSFSFNLLNVTAFKKKEKKTTICR
jgi:hypothetical protein